MKNRMIRLPAALLALSLLVAACGDDDDDSTATTTEAPAATTAPAETTAPADGAADTTAPADGAEPGTIVDVAASTDDFSILVAAMQAAGLAETLSGEGPFTVFAPTDAAFEAALADLGLTADELLADTELLTSVLTYHVIPDEVPAETVLTLDGQSVATVNGAEVTITVDGETVMVDDATVTAVDVEASNGLIHVIDAVLLPPAA